jgi:D-alanine-D-alanine ligase
MTEEAKRKLKIILLADARLLPKGELNDLSEKQRELRKTEFDVLNGLKALGHEVWPIGVSDELSAIRGAIDAFNPHIAFNLVEEFDGVGQFDQHQLSRASQAALHRLQPARFDPVARQGHHQEDSGL